MSKIKAPVIILGIIISCVLSAVGAYFGLVAGGVIQTSGQELVVTVLDARYEYDGYEHTAKEISVDGTFINEDHYAVPTFVGSRTNVGSSEVSATIEIFDEDGSNVTSKYSIEVIPSTVTITKREITIKLDRASKQYDGTPLTTKNFSVSDGSLAPGHSIVPNYTVSVTDVSKGEDVVYGEMIAEIYNGLGIDVTENYKITYDNTQAELTITKKPVTITTLSMSKEFDGKVLNPKDYPNHSSVLGLLDGHQIDYEFDSENFINSVGSRVSLIDTTTVSITNDGEDCTHNYEIIVREIGITTITECQVDDDIKLDSFTYSGSNNSITLLLEDILPVNKARALSELGYYVSLVESQEFELTDAGTYEYNVKYVIKDSLGSDMTSNFSNSSVDVIVAVKPLDVYISTDDVEFEYTGNPYTINSSEYETIISLSYLNASNISGDLYELLNNLGYSIEVKTPNYITPNEENQVYHNIVDIVFMKDVYDKSSNFNLIYQGDVGEVTITKRKISATPNSLTSEYTGNYISVSDFSFNKLYEDGTVDLENYALVYNHTYSAKALSQAIGVSPSAITAIESISIFDAIGNDVTHYYDITENEGEVTITKCQVNKEYIADALTFNGGAQNVSIDFDDILPKEKAKALSDLGYEIEISSGQSFEFTDAGTYKKVVSFDIKNKAGNSVINNFSSSTINATFTVNPLEIRVVTPDFEFEYTGCGYQLPADYNAASYVELVSEAEDNVFELLRSLDYKINLTMPSYANPTAPGSYYRNLINVSFEYDGFNKDNNFIIKYLEEDTGKLTITKRNISAAPTAIETEFTGLPISVSSIDFVKVDSELNPSIIEMALVDGHTYTARSISNSVNVGTNIRTSIQELIIYDANGNDVTEYYKIHEENGVATITECLVNSSMVFDDVTFGIDNNKYDNTINFYDIVSEQKASTFEALGYTVEAIVPDYRYSDVGSYYDVIEFNVFNSSNEDVTSYFMVDSIEAKFTVCPLEIFVSSKDLSFEYTGEAYRLPAAYSANEYISLSSYDVDNVFSLLEYLYYNIDLDMPDYIEAKYGTNYYRNLIEIEINHDGFNKNNNFVIKYLEENTGKLTITPRKVLVTPNKTIGEYTGQLLEIDGSTIYKLDDNDVVDTTALPLANGHSYEAECVAETATASKVNNVVIYDALGNDVTKNYDVSLRVGLIEVIQCAINSSCTVEDLTFNGKNQYVKLDLYDVLSYEKATHFTNLGYKVDMSDISQGYNILNAGSHEVSVSFKILDQNNEDVTECFTASIITTNVNIRPLDVIVKTPNVASEYNGRSYEFKSKENSDNIELSYYSEGLSYDLFSLIDEIGYSVELTAPSYVKPGNYRNLVEVDFFMDGFDRNYNFNIQISEDNIGTLVINKRAIQITPVELVTEYTGSIIKPTEIKVDKLDAEKNVLAGVEPLAFGHTYTYEISGEGIEVQAPIATSASIRITDKDGNDVTEYYEIEDVESSLTITKRNVTIYGLSQTFIYGGQESYRTSEERGNVAGALNLVEGMEILATYSEESEVSLSTKNADNVIIAVRIYLDDVELNNLDNNFVFVYERGSLSLAYGVVEYTINQTFTYSHSNLTPLLEVTFGDEYEVLNNAYTIIENGSDKLINVGTYNNIKLAFEFTSPEARQIADYVTFVCSSDTEVVVNPYDVYIYLNDVEEEFNGQELRIKESFVEIPGSGGYLSSLLGSDYFSFESDVILTPATGDISTTATLLNYFVLDTLGNDVTYNYNIVIGNEKNSAGNYEVSLSYIQKKITFNGSNYEIVYSGQSIEDIIDNIDPSSYVVTPAISLPSGYYYSNPTEVVGTTDNDDNPAIDFEGIAIKAIYNNQECDVTHLYQINTNPGKLIITPLNVTVTTYSLSIYVGDQIYIDDSYLSISNALLDGCFYFDHEGEILAVGTYTNSVTYDETYELEYINITYVFGTITVMPIPVVVTPVPQIVTYGYSLSSYSVEDFVVADDEDFLDAIELDYENEEDYADVGTYSIPLRVVDEDLALNYSTVLPTAILIVEKDVIELSIDVLAGQYSEFDISLADHILNNIDDEYEDLFEINDYVDLNSLDSGTYVYNDVITLINPNYECNIPSVVVEVQKKEISLSIPTLADQYSEFDISLEDHILNNIDDEYEDLFEIYDYVDLNSLDAGTYTYNDVIALIDSNYECNIPSVVVEVQKKEISLTIPTLTDTYGSFEDTLENHILNNIDDEYEDLFDIYDYVDLNTFDAGTYIYNDIITLINSNYECNIPSVVVKVEKVNLAVITHSKTISLADYESYGINVDELIEYEATDYLEFSITLPDEPSIGTYVLPVLLDEEYQNNYNYTPAMVTITITE